MSINEAFHQNKISMNSNVIQTKSYPIIIHSNAGEQLDLFLKDKDYSSVFVLMDENIMEYCWPELSKNSQQLRNAELIIIDAGEEQKDIEVAIQIWKMLTDNNADKSSLFINIGGGVVSDLGGFIASTYKRGIDFIQIPTSLLAMVDASVGGKTGINLQSYKNQIGVFNNPQAIFIQTSLLNTLSKRHLTNGYAEMLKHGIINNIQHWEELSKLTKISAKSVQTYIQKSIHIKNDIVAQDPLETGIRKSLNFGHTMGHIIESWSMNHDKKPLLHGEAIAIGIILESFLSQKIGLSSDSFHAIANHIHHHFGIYYISSEFVNNFENYLNQDKKKRGKKYNFTFVPEIGIFLINQDCTLEEIRESLIYYKENYSCRI